MLKSIDRLQVILKVSERCNLACTYCYYFFGGDDSYKDRPALISGKTVDDLIDFLLRSLKEIKISVIEIALHGGEPLMLPLKKFSDLCEKLSKGLSEHTQLKLSVQTNVTLVTEEWITLFEKYQVRPGLSIDGPKSFNDKFRIDHNGKGSYDKIKAGTELITKAASEGRLTQPGVISVLNGTFDYKKITEHLVEDLNIKNLSFLFPDISHDDPFPNNTTINDYKKAVIDIFNLWRETNNFSTRQIEDKFRIFQKREGGDNRPYDRKEIINNQIICIQSDGTITIDDSFIPTSEWRKMAPTSNVKETTLRSFLEHEIFKEIDKIYKETPEGCKDCVWEKLCRGGDLENRYSKNNGFNNPSVFCEAISALYFEITQHLVSNGYPKDEILKIIEGK
ncbi:radical SAM protein [Pseudoalteromonas sp. XMcav11-Q]|uniref:radical SAM protein n=1 Tax=Pseudoalteromonas sp. XMcav11-Q TaxID=3136665 RepID=UPI0032C49160